MSVGYVSYAAPTPISSSAATLGSQQPATAATPTTTGGNARVATGFDPTPASSVVGGGVTQPTVPQAMQTVAAANNTTVANVQAAHSTVANNLGTPLANDLVTASGGGVISEALKDGVSGIVAFAQKGMADIQKAIQSDMAANNGEVDPAKMQLYTMRMSTYELLNQMAAKIQEKQDSAMQRWLR